MTIPCVRADAAALAEGAVFVVDTLGYSSKITPLDLGLAMQTISFAEQEHGDDEERPDA